MGTVRDSRMVGRLDKSHSRHFCSRMNTGTCGFGYGYNQPVCLSVLINALLLINETPSLRPGEVDIMMGTFRDLELRNLYPMIIPRGLLIHEILLTFPLSGVIIQDKLQHELGRIMFGVAHRNLYTAMTTLTSALNPSIQASYVPASNDLS